MDIRKSNVISAMHIYSDSELSSEETKFMLFVERGDVVSLRRYLSTTERRNLNVDCVDHFGRSAILIAIENENYEVLQVLLDGGVSAKDSLLHAIKEEFVEGVELLLDYEDKIHVSGQPHSWEVTDAEATTFTPDITPLILAAHQNNYEIIKLLLDRGFTLPVPHDVRCGCSECVASKLQDSLRHSRSRINAYRALASPSLIALSSKDPILTTFELSWELRRLARVEHEFSVDYKDLRSQVQDFATKLLGYARNSLELKTLLNYDRENLVCEDNLSQLHLWRLRLAINYKQKSFVAQANVQHLLASIWYEGVPGFQRKSATRQLLTVLKIGALFPFYSFAHILFPASQSGQFATRPFVKFVIHSASYIFFLLLLCLASQRFESYMLDLMGSNYLSQSERGSLPGFVEILIIFWVLGLVWAEIKELWELGLQTYVSDMWNIIDFVTNIFYLNWIGLRAASIYLVSMELSKGLDPYYPREFWHDFDPMLLSEGMFGAAMIFSFLKLVHVFSVNPNMGPLQISLGRMVLDILKFFFVFILVLFAFACGMNHLLWYYADQEKDKCYARYVHFPDWLKESNACHRWRRFSNLWESSQSLFWASFGLVELINFDLGSSKEFTRFWGLLLFGCYGVINIVVLLNMLIAMMSNSYQLIAERSDMEWKYSRSKLWMSYFEKGATVPTPFNIIPTPKTIKKMFCCRKMPERESAKMQSRSDLNQQYEVVMKRIIHRYVTFMQRQAEKNKAGVDEDDVREIKQRVSTFRYELVELLKISGMDVSNCDLPEKDATSRKDRIRERRLLTGFNFKPVENFRHYSESEDDLQVPATSIKKGWGDVMATFRAKRDLIGRKETSLQRRQSFVRKNTSEDIKAVASRSTPLSELK